MKSKKLTLCVIDGLSMYFSSFVLPERIMGNVVFFLIMMIMQACHLIHQLN